RTRIDGCVCERQRCGAGVAQSHEVANIVTTATAITTVDSQPSPHSNRGKVNWPITSRRIVISIIIAMTGTATTPLITADQNSALIGSMSTKLIPTPTSVPTTIVP